VPSKKAGVIPERDFKSIIFTQDYTKVFQLVKEGVVDIGIVPTMILEALAAERNEHLADSSDKGSGVHLWRKDLPFPRQHAPVS